MIASLVVSVCPDGMLGRTAERRGDAGQDLIDTPADLGIAGTGLNIRGWCEGN